MEGKIRNISKTLLFGFILALLVLPAVVKKFNVLQPEPLRGAYNCDPKPVFKFDSLISGKYQPAFMKYLEGIVPYRPVLVRISNQVDYTFFGQLHANLAVIGKNGILFEDTYIRTYLGKDFIGDQEISSRVDRLIRLKDELSRRDIHFILVFAPSKARFMPENFPEEYLSEKKTRSNYEALTEILSKPETGINFLDLNRYFLLMKDTSTFPLYPKGGTHWSKFAALTYASDTLIRYMEKVSGKEITDIKLRDVKWTGRLKEPDDDISKGLNLLLPYPGPPMPYPELEVVKKPDSWKPDLLVIADSYYWILFDSEMLKKSFGRNDFWFYNEQFYPPDFYKNVSNNPGFMRDDLLAHDFVILLTTEVNLSHFFSFPEKTLALLDPGNLEVRKYLEEKEKRIRYFIAQIQSNPEWMRMIVNKAQANRVPLDRQIHDDAQFMAEHEGH